MKPPEFHSITEALVNRWKSRKPIWVVLLNQRTKQYEFRAAFFLSTLKHEWARRKYMGGRCPEHDFALVEIPIRQEDRVIYEVVQVDFSRMFINELEVILEVERWNKFIATYEIPRAHGAPGQSRGQYAATEERAA